MTEASKILNLNALENSVVQNHPYSYVITSNFINKEYIDPIQKDYPDIRQAGSFPLSKLQYGPVFSQFIAELSSDHLRQIIANKFDLDLNEKPGLITVRGRADRKDGKIHVDSKSKIISLLLYMNESWHTQDGCLRLLYDKKNLDNYVAEIPPTTGTLLIFKVTPNVWHGHKRIIGIRKVIQLNYITNSDALAKHNNRHRLSATIKQMARRFGIAGEY